MIVLIIAAILASIFVYLSIGTIKVRKKNKIAIGDGNNQELIKWVRAQGNFVEYSPFILLLLFILEFSGVSKIEILIVGLLFIFGRISHAYSLVKHEKYENNELQNKPIFRMYAMMTTFWVMFYCIARLLITSFYLLT